MLFSQTVGIANNHPEYSFASPHSNVSCEALVGGGGGGDRRCCGMGVGSTVELSLVTLAQCFSSLAHPCIEQLHMISSPIERLTFASQTPLVQICTILEP